MLVNVIAHQRPDVHKIYLQKTHLNQSIKIKMRSNGRDRLGIKHEKNPKEFFDYFKTIDDMIVDMEANKKLSHLVYELFMRGRKLSLSLVFIYQSYFKLPKVRRLNATDYFILKISNKRETQQIVLNHLSDIEFIDFMMILYFLILY